MKPNVPMFFDIETVADPALLEQRQAFIDRKVGNIDRVNFLPEYNQICTIAVGRFNVDGQVVTKTLEGTEKEMITTFYTYAEKYILTGWNILTFDLPFIIKRGLHLGIPVPPILKFRGLKPWNLDEIFIDLARVYQGPTLSMSSLEDTSMHLGIPTPKGIMHGSEVQGFFDSGQLPIIEEYCRHDVQATALIYQRFKDLNFL